MEIVDSKQIASSGSYGTYGTKKIQASANQKTDLITGFKECTINGLNLKFNLGYISSTNITLKYTILPN